MMEHHKFKKRIPKGFGSEKANQPISASFVDQWRTALTPLQIACVQDFTFDADLARHYESVRPSVNIVVRTAAMVYLRLLSVVLSLAELVFTKIRGGPFVWSRAGRMFKALLGIRT